MAIGDIFRLSVQGLGPNAQQVVNVFHYVQTDTVGDDAGERLCQAWVEDVLPQFVDVFVDDCLVQRLEARNVTQPQFGFDFDLASPEPGTLTGEVLPAQVAAVISWRTGLVGRSRRGRSYLWPANEASQNLGQWVPTYLSAVAAFGNSAMAIQESVSGADYNLVIWSETLTASFLVSSFIVDEITGTQRRRRPGAGA